MANILRGKMKDKEMIGEYELIQLDSGHWLALTPPDNNGNTKESPMHWSKMAIRDWIKWHKKVGNKGAFV